MVGAGLGGLPVVDENGWGLRVPSLLISPWARPGATRSTAVRSGVGIVGVSGYGGGEVLRLCATHPSFEVVYVAGDLSDPHGTHRMCKEAIDRALAEVYGAERGRGPEVWLYRGAWQEWEIDRADIFFPLSKHDLDRKIEAIYKHESQKDRALFPGAYDEREFWQRARDRNRGTADTVNNLGLPEFYAVEAYVTTYNME